MNITSRRFIIFLGTVSVVFVILNVISVTVGSNRAAVNELIQLVPLILARLFALILLCLIGFYLFSLWQKRQVSKKTAKPRRPQKRLRQRSAVSPSLDARDASPLVERNRNQFFNSSSFRRSSSQGTTDSSPNGVLQSAPKEGIVGRFVRSAAPLFFAPNSVESSHQVPGLGGAPLSAGATEALRPQAAQQSLVTRGVSLSRFVGLDAAYSDEQTIKFIRQELREGTNLVPEMVDDLVAFEDTTRLNVEGPLLDTCMKLLTLFRSHIVAIPIYLSILLQQYVEISNALQSPLTATEDDEAQRKQLSQELSDTVKKIREMTMEHLGRDQAQFALFPFYVPDPDEQTVQDDEEQQQLQEQAQQTDNFGHWILVLIDVYHRRMFVLDSVVGFTKLYRNICARLLHTWIWLGKEQQLGDAGSNLLSQMHLELTRTEFNGFEQHQRNAVDCGVFVMFYAELFCVLGWPLEQIGMCEQCAQYEYIDAYRHQMRDRLRLLCSET